MILDPGMGYFLASNAEPSLMALREIPKLKQCFQLAGDGLGVAEIIPRHDHRARGGASEARPRWPPNCSPRFRAPTMFALVNVAALRDGLKILAALMNVP